MCVLWALPPNNMQNLVCASLSRRKRAASISTAGRNAIRSLQSKRASCVIHRSALSRPPPCHASRNKSESPSACSEAHETILNDDPVPSPICPLNRPRLCYNVVRRKKSILRQLRLPFFFLGRQPQPGAIPFEFCVARADFVFTVLMQCKLFRINTCESLSK